MNSQDTSTNSAKSQLRDCAIIIAVTVICFWFGGGSQLQQQSIQQIADDLVHRSQGDDLADNIYTGVVLFICYGGAAGLLGASVASATIFWLTREKES